VLRIDDRRQTKVVYRQECVDMIPVRRWAARARDGKLEQVFLNMSDEQRSGKSLPLSGILKQKESGTRDFENFVRIEVR